VVIDMPGGGGLGDPKARDAAFVAADVRAGTVSEQAARDLYGVAMTADGGIDAAATAKLRAAAGD
jgi:N-methylhydantoinase B